MTAEFCTLWPGSQTGYKSLISLGGPVLTMDRHMRHALAPLLFQDDDQLGAENLRVSIVAPAQRSPKAKRKATTKQTEQGTPVHSFSSLLKDLGTVAKNTLQPRATSGTNFEMVTTPTTTQKEAFELLGVGWT